ncbi:MAG: competence/damage-inducible protein A [Myxococcales bacterium]|nr:MAG: competence/damage-inducible protein A [Myxococcales bacterium]
MVDDRGPRPDRIAKTAAALIIGDELLKGKVRDENTPFLAERLFELGVSLGRVVYVPDEISDIAKSLNELRTAFDIVFTSGGVGPTHDDLTLEAIASAFNVDLEESEQFIQLFEEHYGQCLSAGHLRMARLPQGVELLYEEGSSFPTLRMDNVFIFPGVPKYFRMKFEAVKKYFEGNPAFLSEKIGIYADECDIVDLLDDLVKAFPMLAIGSYPLVARPPCVTITFDSTDAALIAEAMSFFKSLLSKRNIPTVKNMLPEEK